MFRGFNVGVDPSLKDKIATCVANEPTLVSIWLQV
jgi:hypothetical protein